MKKIEAVIQTVQTRRGQRGAGKENKIQRIPFFEVKGAGCHQVRIKQYRGVAYT